MHHVHRYPRVLCARAGWLLVWFLVVASYVDRAIAQPVAYNILVQHTNNVSPWVAVGGNVIVATGNTSSGRVATFVGQTYAVLITPTNFAPGLTAGKFVWSFDGVDTVTYSYNIPYYRGDTSEGDNTIGAGTATILGNTATVNTGKGQINISIQRGDGSATLSESTVNVAPGETLTTDIGISSNNGDLFERRIQDIVVPDELTISEHIVLIATAIFGSSSFLEVDMPGFDAGNMLDWLDAAMVDASTSSTLSVLKTTAARTFFTCAFVVCVFFYIAKRLTSNPVEVQ